MDVSILIAIVFGFFTAFILYLLISSNFEQTGPDQRVRTDKRQNGFEPCPVDECATNVLTGTKTCPSPNGIIYRDTTVEVCNPRYRCTSIITPYAVNSDLSTGFDGICEDGVECPCVGGLVCPEYIKSAFTISDGTALQQTSGQRITFPQMISKNQGPIQITQPNSAFCLAPITWLPLSSPGCGFADTTLTLDQLKECMGGQSNCNGYHSSPCLQGTLAIVTSNPDSITSTNYSSQRFGCVSGSPCDCGQAAVYDTNSNSIICKSL